METHSIAQSILNTTPVTDDQLRELTDSINQKLRAEMRPKDGSSLSFTHCVRHCKARNHAVVLLTTQTQDALTGAKVFNSWVLVINLNRVSERQPFTLSRVTYDKPTQQPNGGWAFKPNLNFCTEPLCFELNEPETAFVLRSEREVFVGYLP